MPIQRFLERLVWACLLPLFVLAIALAGFRLHGQYQPDVGLDSGPFRAALTLEAAELLLLIGLAAALASWASRRAGLRLQRAVSSLARSVEAADSARPAAPDAIPIREFVEARQQIENLARTRHAPDTRVSLDLREGPATLNLARDGGELERAHRDLAQSHRELVSLTGRLDTVEEEERRRIARELHDDLQQKLVVIALEQDQAEQALPRQAHASRDALGRARRMTAAALDSVRRLVYALRPQALDDLGLAAALEALVRDFGGREPLQAEWEFIGPQGADASLPEAAASGLYRIAQEALNNVRKHAQASFVHVGLDLSRPGTATLWVADDGRGFDTSARTGPQAFGLLGMQERVHALGGSLHITANPGGGTRVEARLAWPPA
jgi:signal transduction histidine kinase